MSTQRLQCSSVLVMTYFGAWGLQYTIPKKELHSSLWVGFRCSDACGDFWDWYIEFRDGRCEAVQPVRLRRKLGPIMMEPQLTYELPRVLWMVGP